MQVVLSAPCVPGPRGAAKYRLPVRRWRTIGLRVRPHIPVGPGVVATTAAFQKPWMLVRGVRIDLVDDDAQLEFVGAGNQPVKIGEGAEHRIDVAVVGHVIAEITHRRGEVGRQPDGVHAQRGDVVEVRSNAGQVANAIMVGVGEAARVDLVDRRTQPPGRAAWGCRVARRCLVHRGESAAHTA